MKNIFVSALVAAIVSIGFVVLMPAGHQTSSGVAVPQQAESVYDRVMRAGKIRCGYIIHRPFVFVEPNTGVVKGITHDLVEEMAKRLSLNVEWVLEAGWATFIDDLKIGRYDLLCTTIYANSARARRVDFSRDIHYSPLTVWVRADDHRFDDINDPDELNSPAFTLSMVDGSAQEILSRYRFDEVKKHSLPELSPISDTLMDVQYKKADFTFVESFYGYDFVLNNPGSLKQITSPLHVFPNVLMMKKGEDSFKNMIDASLTEIMATSFIDKLYERYGVPPDAYYRPVLPYSKEKSL